MAFLLNQTQMLYIIFVQNNLSSLREDAEYVMVAYISKTKDNKTFFKIQVQTPTKWTATQGGRSQACP